jgi:hypothetical protein
MALAQALKAPEKASGLPYPVETARRLEHPDRAAVHRPCQPQQCGGGQRRQRLCHRPGQGGETAVGVTRCTAGARGCEASPTERRETPFTAKASEYGGHKTAETYHADSALDENGLHPVWHVSGPRSSWSLKKSYFDLQKLCCWVRALISAPDLVSLSRDICGRVPNWSRLFGYAGPHPS